MSSEDFQMDDDEEERDDEIMKDEVRFFGGPYFSASLYLNILLDFPKNRGECQPEK
jgi:hypothetical protein